MESVTAARSRIRISIDVLLYGIACDSGELLIGERGASKALRLSMFNRIDVLTSSSADWMRMIGGSV
ncbi:hypothetical protein KSX_92400 [Ktedonospora formicarum]|uniref:Uncharacterized protein n=1 Tax=Ktedonospora formicarum TaxID=2778364 RepID=A0A8J3I671_9CHLR|nr:hypothetical protein KSX_92400 [Ktedonospora formicarum]